MWEWEESKCLDVTAGHTPQTYLKKLIGPLCNNHAIISLVSSVSVWSSVVGVARGSGFGGGCLLWGLVVGEEGVVVSSSFAVGEQVSTDCVRLSPTFSCGGKRDKSTRE